MKTTLTCFFVLCLSATPATADTPKGGDERIHNAAESFGDIMKVPEKGIPRELFDKAQCVVVVPSLKKGAFLVGGKYGRGFASCRKQGGGWSPPAGVRIEGGSFGPQIGGSSTDILMLVMNQSGMTGSFRINLRLAGKLRRQLGQWVAKPVRT